MLTEAKQDHVSARILTLFDFHSFEHEHEHKLVAWFLLRHYSISYHPLTFLSLELKSLDETNSEHDPRSGMLTETSRRYGNSSSLFDFEHRVSACLYKNKRVSRCSRVLHSRTISEIHKTPYSWTLIDRKTSFGIEDRRDHTILGTPRMMLLRHHDIPWMVFTSTVLPHHDRLSFYLVWLLFSISFPTPSIVLSRIALSYTSNLL